MTPLSIFGIVAAVAFTIGAGIGSKLTSDHDKALQLTQERAAAAAYQARTVELNQVSADLERAKSEKQIVYRTITKRVETYIDRPIYLRDAVDDDGLRDINAALAGATSASEPAAAMPATPATRR